jgi:hypothetical protein
MIKKISMIAFVLGVVFIFAPKTHAQVVVDGTTGTGNSNTTTNWFGVMGIGASFNQNGGFAINPTFRLGNTPVSINYQGSLPGTYAQMDNRNWRNAVMQQSQFGYTGGQYYQNPNTYQNNSNYGYNGNQNFGYTNQGFGYGMTPCNSLLPGGCPQSNVGYGVGQYGNQGFGYGGYVSNTLNAGDRHVSQWMPQAPYTTPYTYGGQGYGI